MSSAGNRANDLGILVLLVAVTVSCATANPGAAPKKPYCRLMHLSSGDGPIATMMVVNEDGSLELERLYSKRRYRRADPSLVGRLRPLAQSPEFKEAVSAILADKDRAPSEYEQVHMELPDVTFAVAVSEEPPGLFPMFRELDLAFKRAFGRRYNISLLPRHPAARGERARGGVGESRPLPAPVRR